MVDGYDSADSNQTIPPELDDYICDYVDGSMDPVVRDAFEEFLQANPHVQAHVVRVAETAALLRAHGRCLCAPDGFDSRLRCAVENECRENSFAAEALSRLSGIVLSGSTIAIVCLGMIVFAYDTNDPQPELARSVLVDMFGENAEALEGEIAYSSAQSIPRVSAPDRSSLQRQRRMPYSPAFMRQIVLEQSPVEAFHAVQQSPVLVLYP